VNCALSYHSAYVALKDVAETSGGALAVAKLELSDGTLDIQVKAMSGKTTYLLLSGMIVLDDAAAFDPSPTQIWVYGGVEKTSDFSTAIEHVGFVL